MEVRKLPVTGDYTLARPESAEEAVALLREYGDRAALLSGGTDLLVQLRAGKVNPEIVIDLKRVKSLRSDIEEGETWFEVGALTQLADLISDGRMRSFFPVLVEAASTVGSVQIRNRATLAGNICNASPAADTVPALLVHDAVVNLFGSGGARSVLLSQFFVGPGKTVRNGDEIVTSVRLPKPQGPSGGSFLRLTRRHGVDLATINVACLVAASGDVRFAFGAVGPTPILAEDRSGKLARADLSPQERDRLIEDLLEETSPISDVRASREYRAAMLLVLSRRALQTAIVRLGDSLKEE